MASAASAGKSTASKRQRDETVKSDNGNGVERAQKGGRSAASADERAVGAAKKVVAAGLKGDEGDQVAVPPRNPAEKTADVTSHRGRGGKGAGAGVGKPGKGPAVMRAAGLAAGQRQPRTSGRGGAGTSLPQFSDVAATLGSGTTFFRPYRIRTNYKIHRILPCKNLSREEHPHFPHENGVGT